MQSDLHVLRHIVQLSKHAIYLDSQFTRFPIPEGTIRIGTSLFNLCKEACAELLMKWSVTPIITTSVLPFMYDCTRLQRARQVLTIVFGRLNTQLPSLPF